MTMSAPWWSQPLLVILGAVVALGGQIILQRWKWARRRRVIVVALEEELRAVVFDEGGQTFGGFSSQTFDELYADIAALLPDDLARQVIRYHFRMKHLEWVLRDRGGRPTAQEIRDMEQVHDQILWALRKTHLQDFKPPLPPEPGGLP